MKILKVLLAASLFATFSFASEAKIDNIKAMIEMGNSLTEIQKGFLYNSIDLVKENAILLKKQNAAYKKRAVIHDILPERKQQMENAAIITAQRIDAALDELNTYIKDSDMRRAQYSFARVVEACTDCHNIVRGW